MMPVSEARPGADAPGDPALVARGLVAGAGAVLVTAAIVFVWRRRDTTTIVGLLGVLAGAVLWSVCSASS